MEYDLKLENKTLRLKSSVFTIYKYQHEFNRDIYKDIQQLGSQGSDNFDITEYAMTMARILYVLQTEYKSFEEFAEELDPSELLSPDTSGKLLEALQLLIPKKQGGTKTAPIVGR